MRRDLRGIQSDDRIEMGVGVRVQGFPIRHRLVPFHAAHKLAARAVGAGRHRAAFDIGDGFVIHRHQPRAGTGFDRHVAQSHAAFHAECANGSACEFDGVASATGCANLADDGQHDVFGGDARARLPFDFDQHVFGFFGEQGLCRQHMLNLGCANAVRQCAESAMR